MADLVQCDNPECGKSVPDAEWLYLTPRDAARVADSIVAEERARWVDLVDVMIGAGLDVSAAHGVVTLNGVDLIADTVLSLEQSDLILAVLEESP
jgi:hypothetical protein